MRATDFVLSTDPTLYETVRFASGDGLTITADLYLAKRTKGWVLLCHQGFCNRGEYRPVAPRLKDLGYSCLAIDQRSGMKVFGVNNETSALAKKRGLKTGYVDSKPDIEAAIRYVAERSKGSPLIVVGSSYSASLALLIGSDESQTGVHAVAAFSPDEYLKKINLADSIRGLSRPTFVTSAKKEIGAVTKVVRFVDPDVISRYRPRADGLHGARSLWSTTEGHEQYWAAFEAFLATVAA
jgi:alpha-beta hydrolase superfamily lysophospholipase